jgi:hypothetical protein
MPVSSHLLERAYQLIDANQIENAKLVLDAVVRVEPGNVETWKTYLQICEDRSDLNWLRQRILRTTDLSEQDRDDILEYQSYLVQQLGQSKKVMGLTKHIYHDQVKRENVECPQGEKVLFELIDVFDYPIIKREKTVLRRSSRKCAYTLTPATRYALALLALFYFSVRLLVLEYFLGYVLFAIFMVGVIFWLQNFKGRTVTRYMKPARAFMLRIKNNPLIINKPGTECDNTKPRQESHKLV